jgi:putative SOS response-associated peptidase YedK
MCSRYTNPEDAELARHFKAKIVFKNETFKPVIYPGYQAPVILSPIDDRRVESRFWGFIARFPGKREPEKMIEKIMQNAVSETIEEKRTFKSSWEKGQRCIIPAKYFMEPKDKKWVSIYDPNLPMLSIAGIWGKTKFKGEDRDAFTMLTCEPNAFMESFHDRMPVILNPTDVDEWLSPDTPPDQAIKLCKPYKAKLAFHD